jgi:hypothetical protein
MAGITVLVGEIISKGVEIVNARTDVVENFFSKSSKKYILKDPNKYYFKNSFNQMCEFFIYLVFYFFFIFV